MGDIPFPPEVPPTKVERLIETGRATGDEFVALTKVAFTGTRTGRIRRKVLFTIVGVSLVLGGALGVIGGGIGLIAMLMLAMTDDVVDL